MIGFVRFSLRRLPIADTNSKPTLVRRTSNGSQRTSRDHVPAWPSFGTTAEDVGEPTELDAAARCPGIVGAG